MIKLSRISKEKIEEILNEAQGFADGKTAKAASDVFVTNLFFEDSTRTKVSFEVAEKKLGLKIINFQTKFSSINKGETLYDTIRALESFGVSAAVIRHSQTRFYDELADAKLAVINAGDGIGHHPSQGLLDLLTIKQEFGTFENLKAGIVGDVKHSRVANSDAEALRRFGAKVYISGPEMWFDEGTLTNGTFLPLDDLITEVDVLILLRIQHERHIKHFDISPQEYLRRYGLTKAREQRMKHHAIIMHPAPVNRGVEIDADLVESPRSRIFKQMQNGVFARMAILKNDLSEKGIKFV